MLPLDLPSSYPRCAAQGAAKQIVEPHRHKGVYIARGKEDVLVTKNMVVGDAVYGEKRIAVEEGEGETKTKVEYRVWNPFRSKIAAAILGGVDSINIYPGAKVLYLGAASGTSVSHVSDIVGEEGCVYAVEFSHRSGRDLINVAKKRTNIIPIIEDARHPSKYRMLIGMVDCVFADVAQPDQARIVALNSHLFLKNEGHTVISIKANCIDSTAPAEHVRRACRPPASYRLAAPPCSPTLQPHLAAPPCSPTLLPSAAGNHTPRLTLPAASVGRSSPRRCRSYRQRASRLSSS